MKQRKIPFDTYDMDFMPIAMRAYLRNYGYSFSKKACDFAVSIMEKKNKATDKSEKIEPYSKEKAEELLAKHGVKLENNTGYNFVYIINMCLADFYKESIEDELHLAKHIKCIIDDIDNNPDNIFRMWIAKMDGNGIPIPWEDII